MESLKTSNNKVEPVEADSKKVEYGCGGYRGGGAGERLVRGCSYAG